MELSVEKREKFGRAVKALRKAELIPAELYGRGIKNIHLAVSLKEFGRVFKEAGANTVVSLLVGKEKHPALIHEVTRDYLTNEVSHIDFYEVRMDEKIRTKIPLEFIGIAPGVRDKGGILNKSLLEVEVEALPGDLPHRLIADVSGLQDITTTFYVKDLPVPTGVKVLIEGDVAVATVMPPMAEEVKEKAPIDLSAVKVETEEKKAERAKEKEKEVPAESAAKPASAKPAK